MSAVIELSAHRAEATEPEELPEWVRDLIAELPPIMSPRTLSEATEISIPTLTRWRKTWPSGKCVGPAFSTPPGTHMVRYARVDVASWLAGSRSGEAMRN